MAKKTWYIIIKIAEGETIALRLHDACKNESIQSKLSEQSNQQKPVNYSLLEVDCVIEVRDFPAVGQLYTREIHISNEVEHSPYLFTLREGPRYQRVTVDEVGFFHAVIKFLQA